MKKQEITAYDRMVDYGTKTITLTVRPKRQTVKSSVSTKAGWITVKWKKDKKADGYIIEYSRDPDFDYNVKGNVKEVIASKKGTVGDIESERSMEQGCCCQS